MGIIGLEKGLMAAKEEVVRHSERLFYTLDTPYALSAMPSIK